MNLLNLLVSGEALAAAGASLVLVLAFRSFPACVLFVLSPRHSYPKRALVLAGYLLIVGLNTSANHGVLVNCAMGLGYYSVVVLALHWLMRGSGSLARIDIGLLFLLLVVLLIAIPATLLRPIAFGSFQILGWELLFKGVSYGLESSARGATMRDGAIFFFVDPTLVYAQRARDAKKAAAAPTNLARLALGVGSLALAFGLFQPLVAGPEIAQLLPIPMLPAYGFALLLWTYCQHSGLASVQIALLRLMGFQLDERYRYPLLARSPADFWRRWNRYIGAWANRYIYFPVSLRLLRRAGGTDRYNNYTIATSVLIAFVAIGLLHDLYYMVERHSLTFSGSVFFAANAVLLLVWEAVARHLTQSGYFTTTDSGSLWRPGIGLRALQCAMFLLAFSSLVGVSTRFS